MSVELTVAALIVVYLAIAALGHVLVVVAVYKCLREDYAGGRRQRTTTGATTAGDGVRHGGRVRSVEASPAT
jgi:hypothetical protein